MLRNLHPNWLPVALGGALGATARHLTSITTMNLFGTAFPLGTLLANGLGSFLIGLVAASMTDGSGEARKQFLIAGFCGGYTTFSIFSLELLIMLEARQMGTAAAYLGLSLAVWLSAVAAGYETGRRLGMRA